MLSDFEKFTSRIHGLNNDDFIATHWAECRPYSVMLYSICLQRSICLWLCMLCQHYVFGCLFIIGNRIEKVFGRLASANICVSKHMQYDLAKHWNIRSVSFTYSP